jgi:hypothetical protein
MSSIPPELLDAERIHAEKHKPFVIYVLEVMLKVLADRCLLWLAMLGTIALYGYAIYDPTWLREVIATSFAAVTFVPQIVMRSKEK